MHPLAVTLLAGNVVAGVDPALRADAVAALHGHHGKQINGHPFLGQLDGASQAGQSAPNHDHALLCSSHFSDVPSNAGIYRITKFLNRKGAKDAKEDAKWISGF